MNNIVIFGATGDLTFRKLLPAIYKLLSKGNDFKVVCVSRDEYDTDRYLMQVDKWFSKLSVKTNERDYQKFKEHVTYCKLEFNNDNDYIVLKDKLLELNCEEISYYLAVSPVFFKTITSKLKENNMHVTCSNQLRNIVFEKPFGTDLQSAIKLNDDIKEVFDEEHTYRIDHYLGKDMIQNILTLRFSNIIIDALWNKDYIESVEILSSETVGVEDRAGYYDKSGALRDMFQNHMLQLLSLCAMEQPSSNTSKSLKDEKVSVLQNVKLTSDIVLGQYEKYQEEVGHETDTETYCSIKLEVDNDRFKGVPFYVTTGKKMDQKKIIVNVRFKNINSQFIKYKKYLQNQLSILVYPNEGIEFNFNMKSEQLQTLNNIDVNFCKNSEEISNTPEAYERLINEFLNNKQELFTCFDELYYTWKLTDQVQQLKSEEKVKFVKYLQGESKEEINDRC